MNLLKLRKQAKLSQKEVAEIMGCSVMAYGRYERGEREPSIEMLTILSRYYNVTLDYLVGNVDTIDRNELTVYEKELLVAARSSDERAVKDAIKLMNGHSPVQGKVKFEDIP